MKIVKEQKTPEQIKKEKKKEFKAKNDKAKAQMWRMKKMGF